jgi:hypothetical protein
MRRGDRNCQIPSRSTEGLTDRGEATTMRLDGSCHCGAVRFHLHSAAPYPYQRCYCSICRNTQGGGGYAINLSGDAATLRVTGRKHITIYHAKMKVDPARASIPARRSGISVRSAGPLSRCSVPNGRNSSIPSRPPSTRRCRCRRNTRTSCWRSRRPGWKSPPSPAISNGRVIPTNRSPNGTSGLDWPHRTDGFADAQTNA